MQISQGLGIFSGSTLGFPDLARPSRFAGDARRGSHDGGRRGRRGRRGGKEKDAGASGSVPARGRPAAALGRRHGGAAERCRAEGGTGRRRVAAGRTGGAAGTHGGAVAAMGRAGPIRARWARTTGGRECHVALLEWCGCGGGFVRRCGGTFARVSSAKNQRGAHIYS